MSQEPPRVNFSGAGFSSPISGQRPKNGNTGRVVALVLGILLLLILFCSGAAVITYRRFNSDSNFGGNFNQLREPIGGAIPNKTRDIVQQAIGTQSPEAEEISAWLENEVIEIDKPRMVMEMQRSGLSSGLINPLSRMMWTLNLDEALQPVDLGENVRVLDFEWLVKDKEARTIVASFANYGDGNYIHVLYLTRQADQWKLFDWRDVLLPMSEAQFWAIYAGLDEPQDQAYHEFADTAYETYSNATLTTPEKIERTLSTFKQTKFPRRYMALAQNSLCSWLVAYEAKAELAEFVKQLSADEFAGAWLYKAQSAAWSNEAERAFEYLRELNKQVGWHPKAAQMAADFAQTPAQKYLAAEWLQRAALLAPVNPSNLNDYFKLADRQQMDSLFRQVAKNSRPSAHVIKLVEALGNLKARKFGLLVELIQPYAELQDALQYLQFKMAVANEDFDEVMDLAPKILRLESLADSQASTHPREIMNSYVTAASKSNSLKRAAEQAPDRDMFLTVLRDRATFDHFDLPPKDAAAILNSIPVGHELREEMQTPMAIARLDIKQGNSSPAFDALLTIYKANKSEITGDEPIEFSYPLLNALGQAALASNRWRELIDVLDPEVLLLMLAWSEEIELDQLQQVLEWYEGVPSQADYWSKYFRSRSAFERGDWPAADRFIVEAIQSAKQDLRFTEDSLPPLVAMMAFYDEYGDYESDIASSWMGVRLTYATRCNALDQLVADAQIADQLDAGWVARLSQYYSMASIESQEKIASMLNASPLSEAQELAEEMRANSLAANGRFNEAFDHAVKRAQESASQNRDKYEQRFALTSAGSQLLKSGDPRRIEGLRQISRGTDLEAYVDCVAATLERDIPTLCKAIKRWEAIDGYHQNFADFDVLKRLQGLPNLRDITVVQPFNFNTLRYSGDESLLVLAAEAAQAADTLEDFLKLKGIAYTVLEHARFDQAAAAVEIKTSAGEFVLTFAPTNPEAFAKNSLTGIFRQSARSLVVCIRKDIDFEPSEARQVVLRKTIHDLLEGLPTAVALRDVGSSSLFCGDGWQQRFGQARQTGIDLAHPKEFYDLLAREITQGFIERDGHSFVVLSEARELLPVKLESQASPWLDEVGVTLSPSILLPCLPADIRISLER